MMLGYYIMAYWEPRSGSREQCAEKIHGFFENAKTIDCIFEDLYLVGTSMKHQVGDKLASTTEGIAMQLKVDRQFPDLGFKLSTFIPDDSFSMRITEYASSDAAAFNGINITILPELNQRACNLLSFNNYYHMVELIVKHFDPILCRADSDKHQEMLNYRGSYPYVGWINYYNTPAESLPMLPDDIEIIDVEGRGIITITTRDRYDADNRHHVESAAKVQTFLINAGIIREPTDDDFVPPICDE